MLANTIRQKICKKSAEYGLTYSASNDSVVIKMFDSQIQICSIGTSLSVCCYAEDIFNKIVEKYGAIHSNKVNLSFVIGREDIADFIDVFAQCTLQEFISDPVFNTSDIEKIESTESEAKVKLRKGQAWLREQAMIYWGGRCAVTGVNIPEILEACHIKPWSDPSSTAQERLSVENVIILSIHLHRLFDAGLISFADDGKLLFSEKLSKENIQTLFGNNEVYLMRQLTSAQKYFLHYHRENIFQL